MHLKTVVRTLNNCILSAVSFSFKELLFRLVVNSLQTDASLAHLATIPAGVAIHMAYTDQHHFNEYSHIIQRAHARKLVFDWRVHNS